MRESVKDDEERELRMKLLQSSGSQDEEAKSRKKKKESRGLEKLYGKAGTGRQQSIMSKSNLFCRRQQAKGTTKGSASQTGGWRWGGEEEKAVDDETSMLSGLTGLPLTEDELLFAGLMKTWRYVCVS